MSNRSINSAKSSPEKPKPKPEHLVVSGRLVREQDFRDIGALTNRLTLRNCESNSWMEIGLQIKQHSQLEQLALVGGDVDDGICKGIGEMIFLRKLTINDCRVSGVGVMQLLDLSDLIQLNLDDNPTIKNGYPSVTVKAFSNILVKFRKLELFRMKIYCANRLFLTNENITDREVRFIADNLKNLIGITLDSNNIGATGAKIIGKNLFYLTFLDLNNNCIADEGAINLARGLPQLNILWLNNNKIGAQGVMRLAGHLPRLRTLGIRSKRYQIERRVINLVTPSEYGGVICGNH